MSPLCPVREETRALHNARIHGTPMKSLWVGQPLDCAALRCYRALALPVLLIFGVFIFAGDPTSPSDRATGGK